MKDFKDLKILVLGDIILDEYVEGTVTRLSPEAPIPILDKTKTWYRLGGASNVAKNIAALGAYVLQMGRIGEDRAGEIVHDELLRSKIDVTGVICDSSIPTIVKTRYVAQHTHLLRVDHEDRRSIEGTEIGEAVEEYVETELEKYDAIILSDYNKGMLYPALAKKISQLCKQKNIISVVDTHKNDWTLFGGFTCITPNKKELENAVQTKLPKMSDIQDAADYLRKQLNLQYLLVTLSEDGMLIVTPDKMEHIPIETVDVVDVTGCGDTAIAVFTAALAAGYSAIDSTRLANKAAGIVCSKMGTASITSEELFK